MNQGTSMAVIKRNLDAIKTADHIVVLGPGGGEVVAEGTPEKIVGS